MSILTGAYLNLLNKRLTLECGRVSSFHPSPMPCRISFSQTYFIKFIAQAHQVHPVACLSQKGMVIKMRQKSSHSFHSKYIFFICLLVAVAICGFVILKDYGKDETSYLLAIPTEETVNFYYPNDNRSALEQRMVTIDVGIDNLFLTWKDLANIPDDITLKNFEFDNGGYPIEEEFDNSTIKGYITNGESHLIMILSGNSLNQDNSDNKLILESLARTVLEKYGVESSTITIYSEDIVIYP